ncbi:MAG: hypothetical protein LLF94_02370 [Chlamydiales bacterium]|nr:hypothetical protein [Chlamydiales bacterium]
MNRHFTRLMLLALSFTLSLSAERAYFTFNYPAGPEGGETLLTGLRGLKSDPSKVLMSGFYKYPGGSPVVAFMYKGRLPNQDGSFYILNYPSSPGLTVAETNLYGPNNGKKNNIQVVGNYTTVEAGTTAFGCLYQGPLDGTGSWRTLVPTSAEPVLNVIAHSTMGGFVVGNYDTQLDEGKAFIYDIKNDLYYDITHPNAKSITAYGIWHNGGHCYTICGGFSDVDSIEGFETGYLIDWDSKNKKLCNFRTYYYNNDKTHAIASHFDGITSDGKGGFNLTGVAIALGDEAPEVGFFAHVKKKHLKPTGNMSKASWEEIRYPNQLFTTGNSVYKKTVIGVYTSINDNSVNGYVSIP